MDRCVTKVQRQGHDKQAAIAICYTSIADRKERRARRMRVINAAVYKADYGARAGQTIQGNLGRDASGHFVRVGAGESGGIGINRLARRVSTRTGRARKPKISEAEQDATAKKVGLDTADAHALKAFAKGGSLDDASAARLEKSGLVERATDGTLRMASNARGVLRGIQNGDERAAADALSRARERLQHATDRETQRQQRAEDRTARQAQRGQERTARQSQQTQARQQREGARATARQQREQKRNSDERQKVTDRIEEVEALLKEDTSPTEHQRTQRLNQLEDLQRRLDRAGGDKELSDRIDKLRKGLESSKELSSVAVFKQADGAYRWMAYSSNAFRDRDGEIVSTKALEQDSARIEGPLRWWHVGSVAYDTPLDWQTSKAGDGIDIGTCDFRAVQDRMLIESGTLFNKSADIGEAVAANPGAFQMSIGFTHPADEPDSEGTYHNIRVFERSLLPRGKAANPFTSIQIDNQEASMASLKEKWEEFVKLFGGDESKAKSFAALTDEKQKEIEASGVAFKDSLPPSSPRTRGQGSEESFKAEWTTAFVNDLPDSGFLHIESGGEKDETGKTKPRTLRHFPYKNANGAIDLPHLRNAIARIPQSSLSADLKSSLQKKAQGLLEQANKETEMDEQKETTPAEPILEVKADAPTDQAAADQGAADGGTNDTADVTFIGDMTAEEFTALLTNALQQALAPLMQSMSEGMAGVGKAIVASQESSAKELTTIKESSSVTVAALDRVVQGLNGRVAELEGDAPTAQRAGYRATKDEGTITQKQVTPPQSEGEISRLAAFMFGSNGKGE